MGMSDTSMIGDVFIILLFGGFLLSITLIIGGIIGLIKYIRSADHIARRIIPNDKYGRPRSHNKE